MPDSTRGSSPASPGQDAILDEEITGTTVPETKPGKRDAFFMLMNPKSKVVKKEDSHKHATLPKTLHFAGRNGLGAYTHDPAAFPPSRVIYYNDDFVAIHDLYPKSSIHTLLLPRSPRNLMHPFEAFEDPQFLAAVQAEVKKLRALVAKELQRQFGKYSQVEKLREAALNGEIETDELPTGRDWSKDVLSGVHAGPSMNHLHVHVFSRDRHSEWLKKRVHYNSFNTPFLIDVEDFPLAKDDPRRHPGRAGYLERDMSCWRCGKNFGRRFIDLKRHLDEEFEIWRSE